MQVVPGPLLAPTRTTGLGGAYIGYAEGVEGISTNPAAPAVREPFSLDTVDADGTITLTLPGFYAGTDFENRGENAKRTSLYDNFLVLGAAGLVQIGPWGAAASTDGQSFRIGAGGADGQSISMQLFRTSITLARSFFHNQLSIGLGMRAVTMLMNEDQSPVGSLLTMAGVSPQLGLLIKPEGQRFRFGAAARAPVDAVGQGGPRSSFDARGVAVADGFVLPQRVVLPAEFEGGISVQVGPRPINPGWQDPSEQEGAAVARIEADREARARRDSEAIDALPEGAREAKRQELAREEKAIREVEDVRLSYAKALLREARETRFSNLPRARILVVVSALVTAPVNRAVAVSGFVSQQYVPYGQSWTVTPRFGLESEPLIDRLTLRVGGYVEPARFDDATPRQHLTFGGDVKLFTFDFFGYGPKQTYKLGVGVDLAPRFTDWGFALGVWH